VKAFGFKGFLLVLTFILTAVFFTPLASIPATASPLYGDANYDGVINSSDATLMMRHILDVSRVSDESIIDLNGDGYVNSNDYSLLNRYILEIISEFPVENSKPEPTPTATPEPEFHVFLLLGQSNMAGYPKALPEDKVKDERVLVLGFDDNPATGRRKDEWDVACPPLHDSWNNALGPGDYFGKTMIEHVPDGGTIGLVPCAISGERIETFMKSGGSKYDWIIHRARIAQQSGGVIKGIIFHQGESNNGDPSWPHKVKTLVEDLRKDLGIGGVPFIAGELLYSGNCAGHNTLVNQLPSIISNCYVVSANGLVVDPSDTTWNLHFSRDSQVILGKRYAEKMIEALGW
jgi:hypothetical protein